MANMFKKVAATSVTEYINNIPKDRQGVIKELHSFIKKVVPKMKPHFAYNMLGYGSFKYKNYKKEIVDWPVIALANQKNYISLYICAVEASPNAKGGRGVEYIAEKYKDKLGHVSVGKSCIRFKKLEDINLKTLKEVLQKAAKNPGLTH